jgi:hypothetical protein
MTAIPLSPAGHASADPIRDARANMTYRWARITDAPNAQVADLATSSTIAANRGQFAAVPGPQLQVIIAHKSARRSRRSATPA